MKVSSTSLLQAFGNPKKEMEGSSTCSSPSFLCHIHHKNPNIINIIQHWESSGFKKDYQLSSLVHFRHLKLKK